MKTKNQTEQSLLESAASAANEDRFSAATRDAAIESRKNISDTARNQAWSPYEVWRTRVKPGAPRP
jgi:hypothetical protein